jgi:hypothetical protein
VYVVVAYTVTISVPSRDLNPVQPFDALHIVASVESQARVEVAPLNTFKGAALKESSGCGDGTKGIMPIVTDSVSLPSAFSHMSVYVVVAFTVTTSLPERAFAPLQPFDAVQVVA